MSAPSQGIAGGLLASRGSYGQNSVRNRLLPPTPGEHEALLTHSFSPGSTNLAGQDRIDKLATTFPRTINLLDCYSCPSTPGPGHHHATASPNKYDVIIRQTMANKVHAEGLLVREIEKQSHIIS